MECNKDEACKAKVISEQKLTENDFSGAKKFALKAQALHPGIEGLSQLIMTINVYVSVGKKVGSSGEVDWYGLLGVTPTADDETIKKQYRKLALMIHPDKNKCIRADDAFKLVSEAWSLLSDKAKRYTYDQRRLSFLNVNVTSNNSRSSSSWNARRQSAYVTVPPQTTNGTFLTNCKKCKKLQEHLHKYQYKTVICSHCRQPFEAVETVLRISDDFTIHETPRSAYVNVPPRTTNGTFLTNCKKCKKLQEHFHKYQYKTVICAHCRQPFEAVETVLRISDDFTIHETPPTSTWSNYFRNTGGLRASAANGVYQQANYERMKRPREEAQGSGGVWKKGS